MSALNGKIALVTGGSRGIGRAIAERLAHDGAQVVVHYGSNETAAKETVAAIEAAGGKAVAVRAELGVPGDVDTLLSGLREHVSEVDILVNNAAIARGYSIETATEEEFDAHFAINVKAPFFLTQQLLPLLRDGGRIINISSGVTRVAFPENIVYAVSKGALDVFGHTLAKHLGPRGITVNTVHPGFTETDMAAKFLNSTPEIRAEAEAVTALGRLGKPEDIADAVAFLASDDARWVTGTTVDVSGGIAL
ncbi:glucose 1-dehydrogenase [Pseudonocardiaceae bacterium YIM PH 21723]|nr:glucose 1-dehydrogenase [Pseudonocardiaceae bacterium YIM PH 21723]